MIATFVEAKRRLAWEARLIRSSLRIEADEGDRAALWVFDSQRGPDGYALRDMMLTLARRERLKLFSFGPRGDDRTLDMEGLLKSFQPADSFKPRVRHQILEAAESCGARLFVVGSKRGTFAAAIPVGATTWEIQHGLLDPSYFPVEADRFFTRSKTSRALLETMQPDVSLTTLNDDLSPPATGPGNLDRVRMLVCYSKNPGGGCTPEALARFECAVVALAQRLRLPLQLKLHPRDSRWKLARRHRRFNMMRYLSPVSEDFTSGPRLVISSFSTALTTETCPGDLLLNVALSPPNPIIAAEYAWLPLAAVETLAVESDFPVRERL